MNKQLYRYQHKNHVERSKLQNDKGSTATLIKNCKHANKAARAYLHA